MAKKRTKKEERRLLRELKEKELKKQVKSNRKEVTEELSLKEKYVKKTRKPKTVPTPKLPKSPKISKKDSVEEYNRKLAYTKKALPILGAKRNKDSYTTNNYLKKVKKLNKELKRYGITLDLPKNEKELINLVDREKAIQVTKIIDNDNKLLEKLQSKDKSIGYTKKALTKMGVDFTTATDRKGNEIVNSPISIRNQKRYETLRKAYNEKRKNFKDDEINFNRMATFMTQKKFLKLSEVDRAKYLKKVAIEVGTESFTPNASKYKNTIINDDFVVDLGKKRTSGVILEDDKGNKSKVYKEEKRSRFENKNEVNLGNDVIIDLEDMINNPDLFVLNKFNNKPISITDDRFDFKKLESEAEFYEIDTKDYFNKLYDITETEEEVRTKVKESIKDYPKSPYNFKLDEKGLFKTEEEFNKEKEINKNKEKKELEKDYEKMLDLDLPDDYVSNRLDFDRNGDLIEDEDLDYYEELYENELIERKLKENEELSKKGLKGKADSFDLEPYDLDVLLDEDFYDDEDEDDYITYEEYVKNNGKNNYDKWIESDFEDFVFNDSLNVYSNFLNMLRTSTNLSEDKIATIGRIMASFTKEIMETDSNGVTKAMYEMFENTGLDALKNVTPSIIDWDSSVTYFYGVAISKQPIPWLKDVISVLEEHNK